MNNKRTDDGMTDLERFQRLFTKIGIEFELVNTCLWIGEGRGYAGFTCGFRFDSDGKFKSHAIVE